MYFFNLGNSFWRFSKNTVNFYHIFLDGGGQSSCCTVRKLVNKMQQKNLGHIIYMERGGMLVGIGIFQAPHRSNPPKNVEMCRKVNGGKVTDLYQTTLRGWPGTGSFSWLADPPVLSGLESLLGWCFGSLTGLFFLVGGLGAVPPGWWFGQRAFFYRKRQRWKFHGGQHPRLHPALSEQLP